MLIVGRIVFVQGLTLFSLDHKLSVQPTVCVVGIDALCLDSRLQLLIRHLTTKRVAMTFWGKAQKPTPGPMKEINFECLHPIYSE